jgi:choline dehydrogenase-like flavoprotein
VKNPRVLPTVVSVEPSETIIAFSPLAADAMLERSAV